MNSIRRSRRRPRVDSVSFESFAWVLVREVALRVSFLREASYAPHSTPRAMLVSVPTHRLVARVRRRLNFRPDLRVSR